MNRHRSLLALALTLALAGCGGGGDPSPQEDRAAITETVEAYLGGLAVADGERTCGAVAESVRKQLEQSQGASCPEVTKRLATAVPEEIRGSIYDSDVAQVQVSGDQATVTLRNDSPYVSDKGPPPLTLERVEDDWKIVGLGGGGGGETSPVATCVVSGIQSFERGETEDFWQKEGRADYVFYIETLCQRAGKEGLLGGAGEANAREKLEKLGEQVEREMARSGRIEQPEGSG